MPGGVPLAPVLADCCRSRAAGRLQRQLWRNLGCCAQYPAKGFRGVGSICLLVTSEARLVVTEVAYGGPPSGPVPGCTHTLTSCEGPL